MERAPSRGIVFQVERDEVIGVRPPVPVAGILFEARTPAEETADARAGVPGE